MRGFVGCRYTSIRAVAPHLCQSLGCLSHSLYQHCSQDSFFYRLMMAKGFPCGSAGKESACNVGDLGSIPGLGKSPGEGDRLPTPVFLGFSCGSAGKESACNVGDLGSIPGLGKSPGEGKGYPLQYSGLENSMDHIVHGVSKSWT